LIHLTIKLAFPRHEKESCSRRKRIRSTTTYITCATCDIQIPATTLHSHRKSAQHKNKSLKKLEEDGVHQIATAFESNVTSYRITDERTCVDLNEFIEEIREKMLNLIQENVEKHTTVKLNLELFGLYTLESSSECTEIRKYYMYDEEFDLIRQKGVFPYSFIDDWSKLDLTHLPDKDNFFDKLKEEHISDVDYERAQKVWDVFDCNTLGDYSDIYLKSDDVFYCWLTFLKFSAILVLNITV
jgi:hypothetical protein